MAKKRLVIANWKGYIASPEAAKKVASGLRKRSRAFSGVGVWLAPGFPLITSVTAALKGSQVKVGAQALSMQDGPQHTGEVSGAMLKNIGATFVIVGHSERRALGESNALVRAQLEQALAAGLTAVLCVGELEQDPSGTHFAYIEEQLRSALSGVHAPAGRLIVAYEPVWAIGKSAVDAMQPEALEEMAIFIRKTLAEVLERAPALKVPILYGGSVEPENAPELIEHGGVGGFLVGHASVELEQFLDILKALRYTQDK